MAAETSTNVICSCSIRVCYSASLTGSHNPVTVQPAESRQGAKSEMQPWESFQEQQRHSHLNLAKSVENRQTLEQILTLCRMQRINCNILFEKERKQNGRKHDMDGLDKQSISGICDRIINLLIAVALTEEEEEEEDWAEAKRSLLEMPRWVQSLLWV